MEHFRVKYASSIKIVIIISTRVVTEKGKLRTVRKRQLN